MADRTRRGRPSAALLAVLCCHCANAAPLAGLPPAQAEFCRLVGVGVRAYDPLLRQWGGAAEPAQRGELRDQLAALRVARDAALLQLLAPRGLRVLDWRVGTTARAITAVTPAGDGLSSVSLRGDALCPTPVSIEARLTVTAAVLQLLRDDGANRTWVVSGGFVPRADTPAGAPPQIVWNASEAEAMRTPTLHLDIIEFRLSAGS